MWCKELGWRALMEARSPSFVPDSVELKRHGRIGTVRSSRTSLSKWRLCLQRSTVSNQLRPIDIWSSLNSSALEWLSASITQSLNNRKSYGGKIVFLSWKFYLHHSCALTLSLLMWLLMNFVPCISFISMFMVYRFWGEILMQLQCFMRYIWMIYVWRILN